MTDREKAIVMAYTGVCMLTGDKYQIFHKYVEEIMGVPVYTHQLGFGNFSEELKRRATPDFMKLCNDADTATKWIPVTERLPEKGEFVVVCDLDREIYTGYMYLKEDWIRNNILAWMPLPEPYKPESEVEE